MIFSNTHGIDTISTVVMKARSYLELIKPRLSLLVAFSSGFGFLLSQGVSPDLGKLLVFSIGGFLDFRICDCCQPDH